MAIRAEWIIFLVTIGTSIFALAGFIWKAGNALATMQASLKSQIATAEYDRRLSDDRLAHLQQILKMGFDELREKFNNFSQYSRAEYRELSDRTRQLENFIQKKFEDFEA